uniref:Zgc:101716 n=1 Tax=Oryzias sinensis TaxID=183150 RepID=A0A8C7X6F4_9TELE
MELFGSTFDDSVFSEARDRVCESLTSYNPKMCEAEWFCESAALETDDAIEKQKVYKFRGDLAMRKGNYQKALEAYSSCLQWIADNNLTIRRDVLEGMARCCTKLGQRDRALDLVDLLSKEASNTCHLTSLLLLKVSIWNILDLLLPFNPWHWLSLGQVCLQLLDPNPAIGKQTVEGLHVDEEEEVHKDWIWLKACISFIRTRYSLWTHVLFKNGTRTCCLHLNHI